MDPEWSYKIMDKKHLLQKTRLKKLKNEYARMAKLPPPENAPETIKSLFKLRDTTIELNRQKRLDLLRGAPQSELQYIDDEGRSLYFNLFGCNKSELEEVKILVERSGIDVNHKAKNGATALHHFCNVEALRSQPYAQKKKGGNNSNESHFFSRDVIKHLVEAAGADMNAADNNGTTPPMCEYVDIYTAMYFASFASPKSTLDDNSETQSVSTASTNNVRSSNPRPRCDLLAKNKIGLTPCATALLHSTSYRVALCYASAADGFDAQAFATCVHHCHSEYIFSTQGRALVHPVVEALMKRDDVDLEQLIIKPDMADLTWLLEETKDVTREEKVKTNSEKKKLIEYIVTKLGPECAEHFIDPFVSEARYAYPSLFAMITLRDAVKEIDVEMVRSVLVHIFAADVNVLQKAVPITKPSKNPSDASKNKKGATKKGQKGPLSRWSGTFSVAANTNPPPPLEGPYAKADINARPCEELRTIIHYIVRFGALQVENAPSKPAAAMLEEKIAAILRLVLAAGADANGRNTDDLLKLKRLKSQEAEEEQKGTKKNDTLTKNKGGSTYTRFDEDEDEGNWFVKGDRVSPEGVADSYPVMLATKYGHLAFVRALISVNSFDPMLRPAHGKGPLPIAFALMMHKPEIAMALLTEGWYNNMSDNSTSSSSSSSSSNKRECALAVDGGSDDPLEVIGRLHEERDDYYVMEMSPERAKPYVGERLPKIYLDIARRILAISKVPAAESPIIRGSWEVNRIILASGGGGVTARGVMYRTQLMRLVWCKPSPLKAADELRSLQLLLDNGADVNAQDNDGYTALHAAVKSEWAEAVKLLLDEGADPTLTTTDGLTPLEEVMARCERMYPRMGLFEGMWAPANKAIIELLDPTHPTLARLKNSEEERQGGKSKDKNKKKEPPTSTATQRGCRVPPQNSELMTRPFASYSQPPAPMTRFSGLLPGNMRTRADNPDNNPEVDFEAPPFDRPKARSEAIRRLAKGEALAITRSGKVVLPTAPTHSDTTRNNGSSSSAAAAAKGRAPASGKGKERGKHATDRARAYPPYENDFMYDDDDDDEDHMLYGFRSDARAQGGFGKGKNKSKKQNGGGRGAVGTVYDFGGGEVEYYSDGNDPYAEFDDCSLPFGFRGRTRVDADGLPVQKKGNTALGRYMYDDYSDDDEGDIGHSCYDYSKYPSNFDVDAAIDFSLTGNKYPIDMDFKELMYDALYSNFGGNPSLIASVLNAMSSAEAEAGQNKQNHSTTRGANRGRGGGRGQGGHDGRGRGGGGRGRGGQKHRGKK